MSDNSTVPSRTALSITCSFVGEGWSGKSSTDTNPYTEETLLEMPLASPDDLDEAYRAAEEAQHERISMLPQ